MQVISQSGNIYRHNTYHNYSSAILDAVATDRNCWHLALFVSYYFVVFSPICLGFSAWVLPGWCRPGGGLGGGRGGVFRCALNGNETFAVAQNANARTLPSNHTHIADADMHVHARYLYIHISYIVCINTIHNALCRGTANIIAYFMQRCTEQTSQLAFANFQFSAALRCFFPSITYTTPTPTMLYSRTRRRRNISKRPAIIYLNNWLTIKNNYKIPNSLGQTKEHIECGWDGAGRGWQRLLNKWIANAAYWGIRTAVLFK